MSTEKDNALRLAREALKQCNSLFSDIRNDWNDPRTECRAGWAVTDAAIAVIDAVLPPLPSDAALGESKEGK